MPNPNWSDVSWNWAAAEEAASTLIRVANDLADLRQRRGEKATLVLEEAAGSYRDRFSESFDLKLLTSLRLSSDCRTLANRLRNLSDQAREEQNRRERAREREREREKERERNRSEF